MDPKKVEELCKSLIKERKWPVKRAEIEEIWLPIREELSEKEQIMFLICLSREDYIFPWLNLISYAIPNLPAEESVLTELIENIVEKVKNDLAQGDFIKSLIDLGKNQPDQAIKLYKKLVKKEDISLIHYSGLILGGVARSNLERAFSTIKEDFNSGSYSVQVACIKALRVGLEKTDFPEIADEVFTILGDAMKQPDESLKIEALQAYVDFDRIRPVTSESVLLEIAKTGPSLLRLVIVDRLWLTNLESRKNEIKILKLCSQDNDKRVVESLARVLSKKGHSFFADSLDIIKELLKKPYSVQGPMFEYYLQEFGKGKLDGIVESFENWVKDSKDRTLRFKVSEALVDFATQGNLKVLQSALKTWIKREDINLQWIAMKAMIELFEKGYFSKESCEEEFSVLKTLSKEPIRTDLEVELRCLFSGRPLFANFDIVIRLITDWARDSEWVIRKTIIPSLSALAMYKIDSEETLRLLFNKETKESRVVGITTRKITRPEGIEAYNLLKELSKDEEENVRTFAERELERIDSILKDKEAEIDERVSKQPKIKSQKE
jgi:hypothetical protein